METQSLLQDPRYLILIIFLLLTICCILAMVYVFIMRKNFDHNAYVIYKLRKMKHVDIEYYFFTNPKKFAILNELFDLKYELYGDRNEKEKNYFYDRLKEASKNGYSNMKKTTKLH